MQFSYFELKQVSALKGHPGFILLIDALKATLDDLTDKLRTEDNPNLLSKWRAFSDIYYCLAQTPEQFALDVLEAEETPEHQNKLPMRNSVPHVEISEEAGKRLLALYEAKKNKLK